MVNLIYVIAACAVCAEVTQQLKFEKRGDDDHYCDVLLNPWQDVTSVDICRKVKGNDEDDDNAETVATVTPEVAEAGDGYFRLEIPSSVRKDGSKYSFQFRIRDEKSIYSQSWVYDKNRKIFAVETAVTQHFYQSTAFKVTVGLLLFVIGCILFVALYRSCCKVKVQE